MQVPVVCTFCNSEIGGLHIFFDLVRGDYDFDHGELNRIKEIHMQECEDFRRHIQDSDTPERTLEMSSSIPEL